MKCIPYNILELIESEYNIFSADMSFYRIEQNKQENSYIYRKTIKGYAFKGTFLMIQLVFAKPKYIRQTLTVCDFGVTIRQE